MARTQVLPLVAALLLLCGGLCSAQTVELASQINTALVQQAAASQQQSGTVKAAKAMATPTRVSQLRDPTPGIDRSQSQLACCSICVLHLTPSRVTA